MKAPLNQFAYARTTPDGPTDVVSPNADTLYSSGWLDVFTEPQVSSLPDFGTRYWLVPILDAWSDVVHGAGSRTVGRTGAPYLVASAGLERQRAQGFDAAAFSDGDELDSRATRDLRGTDPVEVRSLQDRTRLTPLSEWTGDPQDYTPGKCR